MAVSQFQKRKQQTCVLVDTSVLTFYASHQIFLQWFYCACVHQYCILYLMLNNNILCIFITVRGRFRVGVCVDFNKNIWMKKKLLFTKINTCTISRNTITPFCTAHGSPNPPVKRDQPWHYSYISNDFPVAWQKKKKKTCQWGKKNNLDLRGFYLF